eukprot:Skav216053  [mRNA]  locus=scaffold2261:19531:29150:- [translate_table: standard]
MTPPDSPKSLVQPGELSAGKRLVLLGEPCSAEKLDEILDYLRRVGSSGKKVEALTVSSVRFPARCAVHSVSVKVKAAAASLFDAETQIPPERRHANFQEPAAEAEDVRLVALRNLLKSMTEDAASPELRDHLHRMMELADSVPKAEPKASQASSASRPRSLASALLSTTTSDAFGAPPPKPEPDPKAHLATELGNMGFAEAAIREALVHCSTADDAVDWLLARDE